MLTTKIVEQQYDEGKGARVVFYDEDIEVGKACTVEYEEKPNAFLHSFVVKEHLRNKGYGTEILKYMIEMYDVETLHVEKGSKAINLYHRFGFESVGTIGNNMIVMKRRITMPEKLKPCPFCGSDKLKLVKKKTVYKGHKAYVASIRCNCCNARGGTVLNLTIPYAVKEDVEDTAERRWNRRVDNAKV